MKSSLFWLLLLSLYVVSQTEENEGDFVYDEAVIFTGRALSECSGALLRNLVQGANRDVWFLHDHDSHTNETYVLNSLLEDAAFVPWMNRNVSSNIGPFRSESKRSLRAAEASKDTRYNNSVWKGWYKYETIKNAIPEIMKRGNQLVEKSNSIINSIPNLFVAQQTRGKYGLSMRMDVKHDCLSENQPCRNNAFLDFAMNGQNYSQLLGPIKIDFESERARSDYIQSRFSQYKHFWSIEDDIVFTGSWKHFFDVTKGGRSNININDGLQKSSHFPTKEDQFNSSAVVLDEPIRGSDAFIPNDGRPPDRLQRADFRTKFLRVDENFFWYQMGCKSYGEDCVNGELLVLSSWYMARFSKAFLTEFTNALTRHEISGFFELLPVAFAFNEKNRGKFSIASIPGIVQGVIVQGHWGKFLPKYDRKMNLRYLINGTGHSLARNRLYHPVKCKADPQLGMKQLMWSGHVKKIKKTDYDAKLKYFL